MTLYPISTFYICIYECMYVVLTDFEHDIILSLTLSYMPVVIPLTVLECYTVSWSRDRRIFYCSSATLDDVVHSWVGVKRWASILRKVLLFYCLFFIVLVLLDSYAPSWGHVPTYLVFSALKFFVDRCRLVIVFWLLVSCELFIHLLITVDWLPLYLLYLCSWG